MTPRVAKLRQQSLDAVPTISAERAMLMTEAYPPVRRPALRVDALLVWA